MAPTYKYNKQISKHRLRHFLEAVGIMALLGLAVAGIVSWVTHQQPIYKTVSGISLSVPPSMQTSASLKISEPFFNMELPADWKQTGSVENSQEHSISWQATAKGADNRYLTVYIDRIPTSLPVNRELPLTTNGNQIIYGQLSDNCANFTPGGTTDTSVAVKLKPTPSVWQGVNFICNLPNVVDNQIGTGSTSGVNSIAVSGPTSGSHSYFFLYIDRNVQPDYSILYNAIESFRAK